MYIYIYIVKLIHRTNAAKIFVQHVSVAVCCVKIDFLMLLF